MGSIIKEYLILIILAALALIGLIWYVRKQSRDAVAGIKIAAKQYGDDFKTVTTPSNYLDLVTGIFKKPAYISQADQQAAIAKIHANILFRKK